MAFKNKRVQRLNQFRSGTFQFGPWPARQRRRSPRQNIQHARLILTHAGRNTLDTQAHRFILVNLISPHYIFRF
jgi:hypothetical protein